MSEILQGESLINEIRKTLRPAINGVDELTLWLESTLCPIQTANSSKNPEANEHFRLFKNGQTESIIRLHAADNALHIKIWYADLVRRSAPEIVKNSMRTFFNIFFSDVFKPNEPPFFDLYQKEKNQLIEKTFFVNNEVLPSDRESIVIKKLLQEKPEPRHIIGATSVYQHDNAIETHHNAKDEPTAESGSKKILL
jgi:hypothetical protein